MGKITTKTRLLILFISLVGVSSAQVQNENTFPYPHFNDVGVGTTFTTNSFGSINYKFTAAGKLYEHVHFNPETGSHVALNPTIPFRIIAESKADAEAYTDFLFEARVYPYPDPFSSNQRVFSIQKNGELLLGANANNTTSYGFSYSIVSDNSIYSKDKIFAQNRIGIGTTNPAASLDVMNGDIVLNDNRLKLRGAASTTHYLQFYSSFQGSTVNGPVLMGANGGVLGSSNQGIKTVLSWKHTGRVGINSRSLKISHSSTYQPFNV